MRAAEWEFRYRFWIIFGLFALAYACYRVDRYNAGIWLATLGRRPLDIETHQGLRPIRAVFAIAALVAAAGAALRTWAAAWLHSEVVHDRALHAERVVADGPYRHLRNPLYVGLVLAALAMATTMSRVGALVLVVGVTIFSLRLIGREEAELEKSGGESYRRFRAAVPRLVPALRPRLPASGAAPRWGQAWVGEAFFWSFPLALALLAATLEWRLLSIVIGAGLLLRGVLSIFWRRRAVPST